MADVFRLKPIKPSYLKVKEIRLALLNELGKEGTDLKKEFVKTTATWEGEKPRFDPQVSLAGGNAAVLVWPTGPSKGVEKWLYLDQGTRIRWALMSRDWKSKTRPGKLSSGRGAGRVVIAGRRAMTARNIGPRPGIKARGWSVKIGRQNQRRFPKRIGLAIKRAKKF